MSELTYFKRFDNLSDYINYIADDPTLPNVSFVGEDRDVYYMNFDEPTPVKEYLTFKVTGNGNIAWNLSGGTDAKVLQYSKDNGSTWISITASSATTIPVVAGDVVLFKGNNQSYSIGFNSGCTFKGTTCQFELEGNIMSLLYGDNFSGQTTLANAYTFHNLFRNCNGLTSSENLVLPATTLASDCYAYMFVGCSALTTAPSILPSTTLANGCYTSMFNGCTSLTAAPELPATTLASDCYTYMFCACSALTTAPSILPATTLADYCYDGMFAGCTSLVTSPELPATTLADYCYYSMFSGCSSLNYITCLAQNISASQCTYNWVRGVASTGTFVKSTSMSGWGTGSSGIPEGWIVEDA